MKKIIASLLITYAFISLSIAAKEINNDDEELHGVAITLKNGYFYPQEEVLRNIFDRCGGKGGYWVEAAVRYNFWKGMNVEASGSYFRRDGIALGGAECTEVKIPTLGLGLKYFWEVNRHVELFVGAGLRIFFYRERSNVQNVIQCVDKTTAGCMVNIGIEFNVYKGFFIDLFVDYNFGKLNFDSCNCDSSSCNPCCDPCCNSCVSSCSTSTCCSTNQCTQCCPSSCFDIHIGGVVGGVGLGYKF